MKVDEVVKALRRIAKNDEIVFNAEMAKDAADLLEQLTAENEQLKANQPVRCGECKKTNITKFCTFCTRTGRVCYENDYCSYGERREENE